MRHVLFFNILLLLVSCKLEKNNVVTQINEPKKDSIKVFVSAMDTAKKSITLPGQLLPNEKVELRAKLQGYISKLSVDIGSKVTKGQTLAWIEAPEINIQLASLNEKVSASKARWLSSKDYFDRIHSASLSEGVIAPLELEQALNSMTSDSAEYNASLFTASSYKQLGRYLLVVAPYSGIITKRNINVGSYVGNTNDKPLFELEDNAVLKLNVPVPEIYTGAHLMNNTCELTTRSLPDQKFKAKLIRKTGTIDETTRSEIWEFEIPNHEKKLKAGSYTDVKMNFVRPSKSMLLPASSIVTTLERRFVIKVSNHITQWIDVRNGFNLGDKIEVFGDVNAGDTLVLKPTEELKSGTTIVTK